MTTTFHRKKFPVILLLDHVTAPANIGSIFRLADAFGIEKIIFCGKSPDLQSNRLRRTARSTVGKVQYLYYSNTSEILEKVLQENYSLFALEITNESISIESADFSRYEKIALVVGNEKEGVREEILQKAEASIHINMFGNNSSMNVAQATGIALFEITRSLQDF